MGHATKVPLHDAGEDVKRITAEYRRGGYARQAPAIVVYREQHVRCPWPDCNTKITGVDFQLQRMGDETTVAGLLAAWWQGPGLIGICPGCRQRVLFDVQEKRAIDGVAGLESACLPDDWTQRAFIAPKPQG